MKTEIFEKLKTAIKRDSSDTNLEQVSFIAKYCNYELNFYANEEDNHSLVIEHCGYTISNKWYEEILTEDQLVQLNALIDNELEEINNNIRYENSEGFTDSHESTGHSQSDFY